MDAYQKDVDKYTYRAKDFGDFQKHLRKMASYGLPLVIVPDGVKPLSPESVAANVADGLKTECSPSDAKAFEAFFRLVASCKKVLDSDNYSCEPVREVVSPPSVIQAAPDNVYSGVQKSLESIAVTALSSGVDAVFRVESDCSGKKYVDDRVYVNPQPSFSLDDFRKRLLSQGFGVFKFPIDAYEIFPSTGISRKVVDNYLENLESRSNVGINWGNIVGLARRDGKTEAQILLNVAEYLGINISNRSDYSGGLKKIDWEVLKGELQIVLLNFGDALIVSRGWLSRCDLRMNLPAVSWSERLSEHDPFFSLRQLRRMIEFKHSLPDWKISKVKEQIVDGYCSLKGYTIVNRDSSASTSKDPLALSDRHLDIADLCRIGTANALAKAQRVAGIELKAMEKKWMAGASDRAKKGAATKRAKKFARDVGEYVESKQKARDAECLRSMQMNLFGSVDEDLNNNK
ncbi:hypothetical protein HY483_01645 [Candidatus Woesearchaeota archaeon]|nr:hypothetical protein [Candidatus Woesearchaeota archaeon]